MKSGIYCIENTLNGKQYYGQSYNVEKRIFESHSGCKLIYNSIKKYGKENFNRKTILYCEEWELKRYEILCIKIFHSHMSEGGYNMSFGGDAPMRRRKHSEETIKLMSKVKSGENHPLYGTHCSDKTKKLMSESQSGEKSRFYGTHPSDKTRELLRRNHSDIRGVNNPNYGKFGKDNPNYGSHRSEETKKLMSEVAKKRNKKQ